MNNYWSGIQKNNDNQLSWSNSPPLKTGPNTLESSTVEQFHRRFLNCHWHSVIPILAPWPMWGIWSLYRWQSCVCPFESPFNCVHGNACSWFSVFWWRYGPPKVSNDFGTVIGSISFIKPIPCMPRFLHEKKKKLKIILRLFSNKSNERANF